MFLLNFFITIIALFSGLVFSNLQGAQSKAADTERKSDINSIYQKLEEAYNESGEYPTQLDLDQNYDQKLPGLDRNALIDPNGKYIEAGDYSYLPTDCTATGCAHYTLSATLDDSTKYTKDSLN